MSSKSLTPADNAVAAAEAMLTGDLGLIEGSRLLASLAHDLVADWRADDDFVVFGAFASETDNFPAGPAQRDG